MAGGRRVGYRGRRVVAAEVDVRVGDRRDPLGLAAGDELAGGEELVEDALAVTVFQAMIALTTIERHRPPRARLAAARARAVRVGAPASGAHSAERCAGQLAGPG